MERSNFDNTELGILFNHRPIKTFSVDRDAWTDIFNKLLDCGFDSYGYVVKRKLEKFIKHESAISYISTSEELDIPVNKIITEGKFVSENIEGKIYSFNDKFYLVYEDYEEKYWNDFDRWCEQDFIYNDALYKWLNEEGYESEEDIPKDKIIPYEIQALNPGEEPDEKRYKKIVTLYNVKCEEETNTYFDNGVFLIRPYYWGDAEEIQEKPNFVHYAKNLELNWYKYPLRSATVNQDFSNNEFEYIINDCIRSIEEV